MEIGQLVQIWRKPFAPYHGAWGIVERTTDSGEVWLLIGLQVVVVNKWEVRPGTLDAVRDPLSDLQRRVLHVFQASPTAVAIVFVAAELEQPRRRVYRALRGLRGRGLVLHVCRAGWQLSPLGRMLLSNGIEPTPLYPEAAPGDPG